MRPNDLLDVLQFLRDEVDANLSVLQLAVLSYIMTYDGSTQTDIINAFRSNKGTISRIVYKLSTSMSRDRSAGKQLREGLGFLELREDPDDARHVTCHLTEKGLELKRKLGLYRVR